jgi:hypothetical protein
MTVPSIEELIGSTSQRLTPFRDYRMIRGSSEAAYLSLFAPPQGQVLATVATRVNHFSELSDDLPSLGLPTRMKDCLVYYACWQLLSQRLPVGQEELRVTQRQIETDNTVVSEVTSGSDTQTTTDDKTQTEIGTKDGTVTEAKTGSQDEVTDTEQTETKDESLSTIGGEVTTDVRTASTTGSTTGDIESSKISVEESEEHVEDTLDKWSKVVDSGHERLDIHGGTTVVEDEKHDITEVLEDTPGGTISFRYDEGTPPRQTEQINPHIAVTTTSRHLENKRNWLRTTEPDVNEAEFKHFGKEVRETGEDHDSKHTMSRNDLQENTEEHRTEAKSESTSEDSQGTVTKNQAEATIGNNLIVSAQEKTTTDNLLTETLTDEDSTNTVLNTGTSATELLKDTTTATSTEGDKITAVESLSTYRDRLQTAQYYKLLMDMEVQSKKMRSWTARGL